MIDSTVSYNYGLYEESIHRVGMSPYPPTNCFTKCLVIALISYLRESCDSGLLEAIGLISWSSVGLCPLWSAVGWADLHREFPTTTQSV